MDAVAGTSNASVISDTTSTEVINRPKQPLPPFSIPVIDMDDKLKGHGNFRSWKQRIERDIVALGRSDFLQYPLGGEKCTFSNEEKRMYDAQVRQYLEATIQNAPRQLISNESTAADAFHKLENMFGKNDVQKMVDLLDNFGKIVLHPKMNPMTFVTKFEDAVQQFRELGVPLDQKIIVAYFLHKVRHVRPFMGFYTTIATLPEETRPYEFVRNAFLDVASSSYSLEMENRNKMERNTGEPPKKKERFSASSTKIFPKNKSIFPYTNEQVEKMKKMTPEEKRSSRCTKCGLLFHKAAECKNDGRFCFFCHRKGHDKKDCKKLQTLKSKS
ncbi:uncharacterized protein LOC123322701 isoform X2 [Coccinella septempunctata]|uniref:uncharacterized protein LOC123322701 isoform X2 n=1 Tax=Coccinella septempunctata TaxID=41139 RepID=UPI001D067674|nr:uncharacterized protein LOC123322701 isoform X2 [Coccinella septempunctata]